MISTKTQLSISLVYFLLAAALGVFLRSLHFFDLDVTYKFIVHGHSHIALLGWVYVGITALLNHFFIPQTKNTKRSYKYIFWFTQFTLIGMLVTFPFQGYALLSITFSTLFLFASYAFCWFFFKNTSSATKQLSCYPYIKASLFYLMLSSIGPWALGAIMTTLGSSSVWYKLAIYFYLHFQYNGWMLLALLGVTIFLLERRGVKVTPNLNKRVFILLQISVLMTFFLSTLWTEPDLYVYALSFIGALIQIICLGYVIHYLIKRKSLLKSIFSKTQMLIFNSILLILTIKVLLQFIASFPLVAQLVSNTREFAIAYLHLTFLGIVTLVIFLIISLNSLFSISRNVFLSYLLGFIITEVLIIYKALTIWSSYIIPLANYYEWLLAASLILFISILIFFIRRNEFKTA